jgi:hypothetical protein
MSLLCVVILSVIAVCCYSEFFYDECHSLNVMPSVLMLSFSFTVALAVLILQCGILRLVILSPAMMSVIFSEFHHPEFH